MCIQINCAENYLQRISRKSKASGKCSIPERQFAGYSYTEMTIISIRLLSHLQSIYKATCPLMYIPDKAFCWRTSFFGNVSWFMQKISLRRDFGIQGTKSALISVEWLGFQYSVILFSEIEFPKHQGTHLSERMGYSPKGGEPRVTAPAHQHQQRCSFKEHGRAGGNDMDQAALQWLPGKSMMTRARSYRQGRSEVKQEIKSVG